MTQQDTPSPPPARRTVSIAVVLLGGIGGLIVIAQLVVMAAGLITASRNTVDLLRERATHTMQATVKQVHAHLAPADRHALLAAELIAENDLVLDPAMLDRVWLTMLVNPQIRGSAIVLNSEHTIRIGRDGLMAQGAWSDMGVLREEYVRIIQGEARWSEPIWSRELGETIVAAREPIRDGGKIIGYVATAVTASELSEYLDSISTHSSTVFIIDGGNHVIAHPSMERPPPSFFMNRSTIPTIAEMKDPFLTAWAAGKFESAKLLGSLDGLVADIVTDAKGHEHVVLVSKLDDDFPHDWRLGISIDTAEADLLFDRLQWSAAAGLVVLAISLLILARVARAIRRPITALAEASEHVRRLDVDAVTPLPATRLTELAQASDAFNKMVGALRWFETYVPKRLVARIMRDRGDDGLPTRRRLVTILFTDIPGFTTLAEGMDARAVAGLLNHHFTLIAGAVEAEGGVIDKYIGDSVMAFWGAPARQQDHATRAVRAARAIAEAVRADNARRVAAGELPIRIRIGLHDGEVVAGNIGAPGRINYTLVGDAVNIANRLEALGKEIDPSAEVIALASADTVANAAVTEDLTDLGPYALRGRVEPIQVYRLV
ncbi:MAG: adenylate/guanylate cyclase domain-containing protein [Alphaproteobacteria bacterium]|nr:adenylate/guanylate cyclase domain-containing protein [Alphaproteobacteria bacterium]